MRSNRWRILTVLTVTAALLATVGPVSGSEAATEVQVTVKYTDKDGKVRPAAGVEVFLWDEGVPRVQCTGPKGKTVFKNVTPGSNHLAAAGVGAQDRCKNWKFLNPSNNKPMLSIFYKGHHGVVILDQFTVVDGERFKIFFKARTPAKPINVCTGLKATITGDAGPNDIQGTPGNDVINGGGGHDRIRGLDGDDVLCGGKGRDYLAGGGGDDLLLGEGGNDKGAVKLWGGQKAGLIGGPGDDGANGGAGNDRCVAESETNCEA